MFEINDLLCSIEAEHSIRQKVRNFIRLNEPPKISPETNLEEFVTEGKRWQKKLFEAKLLGNFVPEEYGGCGTSYLAEAISLETLGLEGSPQLPGILGLTMLCPVLIKFGSSEQKKLIPKILEGQILACQCFSEPEAGTDLGNLKSTLIPTDGGFILNGQKIWTSFAKYSQLGFALARITNSSDFTANPNTLDQRKIVFILVDFVNPRGQIKVSPIQQLSGEAEFCEIFFDNVFIPSDSLVGDETNGWKIALETLIIERILLTFARHTQTIRVIKKLVRLLERKRDDVISDAFLNYVSEFNLLRLTAYKHVLEYDRGKKISAESSIDKLLWSENFKKFAKLYYSLAVLVGDSQDIQEARKVFLYSLGRTIAAGTSEIHSLTIAQRLLNLPKSY